MGSISTYPSPPSSVWASVLDDMPGVEAYKDAPRVRCLRMMMSLFVAISIVTGSLNAQGEEGGSERSLTTRIEPEYPDTLQRLYIGGIVRLELTITPKGRVENVILLGGNPILGQSAMSAVKKWRYAPANSRSVVQVKIRFDPHR